jgi:hypothetical protein
MEVEAPDPGPPDRLKEALLVRKTLTALAAAGLLLVAACADEHEGTAVDPDRTTTSEPDEPDEPTQTTTTTTADPDSGGPGGQAPPDDDPGNNQACEGQAPVWADAPAGGAQAELAAYDPTSGAQTPSEDCVPPETRPEPELGTGDVQITLRWESSADLDLHVTEPDGTEIWYADKGPTATGGRLDVDSNVACDEDGSVENVFWPTGQMPQGGYTVEVDGFSVQGCGSGQYTVTAQVEGREVLNETGSVGEDETDTYEFDA